MLLNSCGTPYQAAGSIQQFDPENPELNLFNLWDQEIIQMGGSPIFYYEVFIQEGTVDPIYWEDRGKIFSNNPIQLYCTYEPISSTNDQGAFGIDSPDEMLFELNYKAVLDAVGHAPKIGSRLYTPHLRENWVIVQRNLGEFKLWGAMRLTIIAQRFQESVTTGEGNVTQKAPDFKIV
jgi:hypothetical protein